MDVAILGAALCLTNLAGRAITATPVRLEGAVAELATCQLVRIACGTP